MNANCAIDYDYSSPQGGHSVFAPGAEQQWLLQYLPLVKRIVSQLSLQANQVLDREDMEQIGLMGLLEGLAPAPGAAAGAQGARRYPQP
jgi:RNA polymerase sigma factor for flagellar operon FliA